MTSHPAPGIPFAVPRYIDIKNQLTRSLMEGIWKPGDLIPSERRLAEQFGASIGTVRKAIDVLAAENILIRQQGRGTFVANHTPERTLFHFFHVVPKFGPRVYPEGEFLDFSRRKCKQEEAEGLGIRLGDPVFQIRNRLRLAGEPAVIDNIVLPVAYFPKLTGAMFRDRPSTVYNLYQVSFGVSVVRATERLSAVAADEYTADALGIAPDSPLLQIRRIAYTYNIQPVELRVSMVNTERTEYWAEIGTNSEGSTP